MFLRSFNIISDIVNPSMPNYELKAWLPTNDTPITCDIDGNVVSVFSDNVWDFTSYSIQKTRFNFGDRTQQKGYLIDDDNIRLFKIIATYWLWGISPKITASTFVTRCEILKPLVYTCSTHKILISDLSKHNEIFEEIACLYSKKKVISLLQDLYAASKDIGFVILDENALKQFSRFILDEESTQTPYIPPRIWMYQVNRFQECINDFHENIDNIRGLFVFLAENHHQLPKRKNAEFLKGIIDNYKVYNLLLKWSNSDSGIIRLNNISSYLSLVSFACTTYIINFSLMRITEAQLLRYGCMHTEIIDGQEVFFIKGETTKTVKDNNAVWVVPESAKKAVEALELICELRFNCAKKRFGITDSVSEYKPYLNIFAFEPWSSQKKGGIENLKYIKPSRNFAESVENWGKLLDKKQLKIDSEDMKIASRMTANLNQDIYFEGGVWQLSWHQFRRTGAVNMLASGLVSEQSLQFQLKHCNSIMSLYYANNYYKLKFTLNSSVGELYLQEWHNNNVIKNKELSSDRFISPHGQKRKAQIIAPISEKDHKTLINMSKKGNLIYRETFLGGCTKKGEPCPYGGISNIIHCMGGDGGLPCDSVLLDKDKLSVMKQLETSYVSKISNFESQSLPIEFQTQQLNAIRKAIHAIESKENE